jgi:redox-sensitive bicupin YhaK (pirin superfamily)
VTHSEFNGSDTEPVHFLQIWIEPNQLGIAPRFEDLAIAPEEVAGKLRLIASPDGRDGSPVIQQDASVYISHLDAGQSVELPLAEGRYGWIQVARGGVTVNGVGLKTGDGAAATAESKLSIEAGEESDILLFDLA